MIDIWCIYLFESSQSGDLLHRILEEVFLRPGCCVFFVTGLDVGDLDGNLSLGGLLDTSS